MDDATFKDCEHQVGKGKDGKDNKIASKGTEVSKEYNPDVTVGYKPDVTVEDANGNLLYILECEQKTDRKAFLGDFIKAEFHAEHKRQKPALIIVMQECNNTTTEQIAAHLRPYIEWLKSKGGGQLSLSAVRALSDKEHKKSISAGESVRSPAFKKRGHYIN